MTGLVRFLRKSVEEIHNSVKTYTKRTLVIHCHRCNNHVPVRVFDVLMLTGPEEFIEIKCERCSHVVCFTAGREYTAPRPYEPQQVIYSDQQREFGATIQSLVGNNLGQLVSDSHVQSNQNTLTGGSNVFASTRSSHVYGDQDSASDDSLRGYFEDQNPTFGQCSSHRSSISLPQKPSLSQSRLNMFGLEQCSEKTGTSRNSWDTVFPSLYRTDSPMPLVAPILRSHLSLSRSSLISDGKPLKPDDAAIYMELEKSEDGCAFELSVSRRNSGDSRSSFDLTPGRAGPGTVGRRDSDSESVRVSDSDTINIRGSVVSEKRRGKMPMRSNAIHRRAVSRSHSLKIEQEEQHEAETLSAKRRNSITTDFDVEPSDEEIRQAYKIYTEASQQQSPHPESDIQWARVILRRRKNWEHMRYEHPLRCSTEQLQLKQRNSIESAASARLSGLVHQPLPLLTIQTLPNMPPRISSFTLPTPVKEESEGDVMSLRLTEYSTNQFVPESSVSAFGAPESLEPPKVELEKPASPPSAALGAREARPNRFMRTITTGADLLIAVRPKSKSVRTHFRKALRNITKRISRPHEGRSSLPPPCTQPESADPTTRPMADMVEPPSHRHSRSSGEIQDVPTSEELIRVGNEISNLVGEMTSPSIQIQFHARTEDLFPMLSG